MKPSLLGCLTPCLLFACGDGGVDRKVEDLVTIQKGLYGQITSVNDVGEPDPAYQSGFGIDVFQVPAGRELGDPIAHTASAERGFYQLELAPADYVVCSTFRRCVRITLGDELFRLDYEFGPGRGWNMGTTWP